MLQVISFFFIDSLLLSFKVTYSFLSHGGKKRTKESPPSAHLPLKITHVFLKRENSQALLAQTARAF
ncbi:MAG: hypothetical protein IJL37_00325 [Bacteroidaceae bacterium]|nr:hypothetical protein [Bacteroidaceae bacterium]